MNMTANTRPGVRSRLMAAGLALVLVAIAGPAGAQVGRSNEPISVNADSLEVIQSQRVAIYRGNVEAIQGPNRIRAQEITVLFRPRAGAQGDASTLGAGFGEAERLTAVGNVIYATPTEQASGDRAVYEVATDTITMTGVVTVVQGENVIRGCELVVQQTAGRATMKACGPDRSAPTGRVRSVFVPGTERQP
jgi:lipopolysaccharide export system protein LptA